jgi:hypothetical protein
VVSKKLPIPVGSAYIFMGLVEVGFLKISFNSFFNSGANLSAYLRIDSCFSGSDNISLKSFGIKPLSISA